MTNQKKQKTLSKLPEFPAHWKGRTDHLATTYGTLCHMMENLLQREESMRDQLKKCVRPADRAYEYEAAIAGLEAKALGAAIEALYESLMTPFDALLVPDTPSPSLSRVSGGISREIK